MSLHFDVCSVAAERAGSQALLGAIDATACTKQISQVAAVAVTSIVLAATHVDESSVGGGVLRAHATRGFLLR